MDWTASVEFLDFAKSGEERSIPVPRGAQWCTLQLVAMGEDGDPPKGEVVVGKSNAGANAVFQGEASLVLTGQLGEANRAAMTGAIDVRGVGHLHLRLRQMGNTTSVGGGVVHAVFG